MRIKFNNKIIDDKFISELDNKCKNVNAHGFKEYLTNAKFGGKPVIEVLKELNSNTEFVQRLPQEKNLNLTIAEQEKIVVDFYSKLSPELGSLVKSIFEGKDSRYSYSSKIVNHQEISGNAYTKNGFNKIGIEINTDGGVAGLRIMAHEISHGISANITTSYNLINGNDKTKADNYFHHLGEYSVDSIGEIESYIIELLFNKYLLNNNIITEDDYNLFLDIRNNSFKNNVLTNIQETYILQNLSCPITPQSFEQFEKKIGKGLIKSKKYKTLMQRVLKMHDRSDNAGYSQYDFRYIIGEIVSSVWFNNYQNSNKQEKEDMLKTFIKYLSKTDQLDFSSSCNLLLNQGISQTIDDYKDIPPRQQNIQP